MSFDIDKQPLTLLSNDVSNKQENEFGYTVEVPLNINDQNWNTVSQYVYTNMLHPKYEKEYKSAIRSKGYVISYNDLNKQAMMAVVFDALHTAYEKLILTNDHLANILVKTGNTKLVFDGAFLDAMFQRDAASIVGDVLMSLRKNLVQKTIALKDQEKAHQLVPLLQKIYTAFLWLKTEILENGRDITKYEGKTLDEIIASVSGESFQPPSFETCRQVYARISIPVEIIENIKNSPKKFILYESYFQTILHPDIFSQVKDFILHSDQPSTSLEEILCQPIPIEIIKVFSSDVNKLVPQVRKMFLRKGYDTIGWQKDKKRMLKVAEYFAEGLFPTKNNVDKERIVNKLIKGHGSELISMIAKTKNKKILELLSGLEQELSPSFTLADVDQAEKFSLNAVLKVEPLSDDEILSRILEDARIAARINVDKNEKSPFSEQTTISYNSEFSPFMTSDATQLIFDNLHFPTIAHYVIFKLVSSFPNIKHSELITFYNNVLLCGDKNVPEKKFISFERLLEIYIQLYQSITFSTKKFYLENALREKFLLSDNKAQLEVAKHASEVFFSSNKADQEMSQLTVDWLNQNKDKILTNIQQVQSEILDFKDIEKYKNIFAWVCENINDFLFSVNKLFLYCEYEINENREDEDTKDCVETFATKVYFKNKSEIALAKTDLASINAPDAIKRLFRGQFRHLYPAVDYIYRIIIAPLYFTSKGMSQSVVEIEDKIRSAQRSLSNPSIRCFPQKLLKDENQLATFREKIDDDHKCILTALITVLIRLVDFSNIYQSKIKIGYVEVTLAASIIYNHEFEPIRENKKIVPELKKYLRGLVDICFDASNISHEGDTTVIAIFSGMQKIASLLFTSQTIKQNRTLHFVDEISNTN